MTNLELKKLILKKYYINLDNLNQSDIHDLMLLYSSLFPELIDNNEGASGIDLYYNRFSRLRIQNVIFMESSNIKMNNLYHSSGDNNRINNILNYSQLIKIFNCLDESETLFPLIKLLKNI